MKIDWDHPVEVVIQGLDRYGKMDRSRLEGFIEPLKLITIGSLYEGRLSKSPASEALAKIAIQYKYPVVVEIVDMLYYYDPEARKLPGLFYTRVLSSLIGDLARHYPKDLSLEDLKIMLEVLGLHGTLEVIMSNEI